MPNDRWIWDATTTLEALGAALYQLQNGWESLSFDERQALLREVLDRVNAHDDRVDVVLRDTRGQGGGKPW